MKNLNDLSNVLFETLKGIQEDNIDHAKAKSIVEVSNSLINNGKLQLQAAKYMNVEHSPEFFGLPEKQEKEFDPTKAIAQKKQAEKPKNPHKAKNLYDAKLSFANAVYESTPGKVISEIGSEQFEREFKQWMEN